MAALKNARYEAFCLNRVNKQMAIGAAFKAAGFKPIRANATRLSRRPEIIARIAELQARLEEKTGWTAEKRLKTLEEIAQRTERKDPKTTISAIAEANKMQGSYAPTKQEHTGKGGGPIEYANLSEEEIDARIAALTSGAGDAEPGGEA